MPYFELETKPFSDPIFRQIEEGEIIRGQVKGKESLVEIHDEDELSINGVLYRGAIGTTKFDTKKFSNKYIVFLTNQEVAKVASWYSPDSPGAFFDALESVERRAKEYLGLRKIGHRSFLEKIGAVFSAGATEAIDL